MLLDHSKLTYDQCRDLAHDAMEANRKARADMLENELGTIARILMNSYARSRADINRIVAEAWEDR